MYTLLWYKALLLRASTKEHECFEGGPKNSLFGHCHRQQ